MSRVVVALSGGVDSAVAAHLIKEQGHEVLGLFMKNWHNASFTNSDDCPWEQDSKDALLVADHLGIPFHTVDLSRPYYDRVVRYMFEEYEQGRTPNPDVLCNREIKFDAFWEVCRELSADFVATGHYCRREDRAYPALLRGKDPNKDQSYFLCQLSPQQLSRAIFPLGALDKQSVRKMALEQGLPVANKKDSQGLCFVGKIKLPHFLSQKIKPKEGTIRKLPDRFVPSDEDDLWASSVEIGKHQGTQFFTIGQRKGLNIGGSKAPLFVICIDHKENILYVGEGRDHPGLRKSMVVSRMATVNWLVPQDVRDKYLKSSQISAQIRYRQKAQSVEVYSDEAFVYTRFREGCFAPAKGQFVVWYFEEELLGSAVIDRVE